MPLLDSNLFDLRQQMIAFVELVNQMRIRQNAYFRSRASDDLIAAREAERAVDLTIKQMQANQ